MDHDDAELFLEYEHCDRDHGHGGTTNFDKEGACVKKRIWKTFAVLPNVARYKIIFTKVKY